TCRRTAPGSRRPVPLPASPAGRRRRPPRRGPGSPGRALLLKTPARAGMHRGLHLTLELEILEVGVALEPPAGEHVAPAVHPHEGVGLDTLPPVEELELTGGHARPFRGLDHHVPARRH